MEKQERFLKPHYLFFIISIVLLAVIYVVYLFFVGNTYTWQLYSARNIDLGKLQISFSEENVVEVADLQVSTDPDDGSEDLFITLKSIHPGRTQMQMSYRDELFQEYDMAVFPMGLLYMITFDSFRGLWGLLVVVTAASVVTIITLSISFARRERRGAFSYSMVMLGGAIFFLTVCVVVNCLSILLDGWRYSMILTVKNIFWMFSNAGRYFIDYTLPLLLVLAVSLSVSNIWLVRHEGFRPANLLGFLIGVAIIGGVVLMEIIGRCIYNGGGETLSKALLAVNTALTYVYGYLECMLFSTIFCAVAATRYKVREPADYLIILGCAIRGDGSPTPLLRGRIDRALAFAREQGEQHGRFAKFVPSGGQGGDEIISEAESMKRYLMENGVPEEYILKEDKSVNTYENMAFSKRVIEEDAGCLDNVSVVFSTTNYHVFRGYTLADRMGMRVKGLSAKTKRYFFPNAFIREFIGLLWEQKWQHLIVVGAIVLGMTAVTLLLVY